MAEAEKTMKAWLLHGPWEWVEKSGFYLLCWELQVGLFWRICLNLLRQMRAVTPGIFVFEYAGREGAVFSLMRRAMLQFIDVYCGGWHSWLKIKFQDTIRRRLKLRWFACLQHDWWRQVRLHWRAKGR